MKRATVIGHFAFGLEYLDGQTVKTKMVADELCRQLGDEQIERIDTHGGIKALLKAPFQIWKALKNSRNVIILPAHNGLMVDGRRNNIEPKKEVKQNGEKGEKASLLGRLKEKQQFLIANARKEDKEKKTERDLP